MVGEFIREPNTIYVDAKENRSRKQGFMQYIYKLRNAKESGYKLNKYEELFLDSNIVFDKALPCGDYVYEDCCIEVKEYNTGDLIDSITHPDRLPRQADELHNLKLFELYENPFQSTTILIVGDDDCYNHIHNAKQVYKGLLNIMEKCPVAYAKYTYNSKIGNIYEKMAESILYKFGVVSTGRKHRISHENMKKGTSVLAESSLASLNTLNRKEINKICKGEGYTAWNHPLDLTYNTLTEYVSPRKAETTICRMNNWTKNEFKKKVSDDEDID